MSEVPLYSEHGLSAVVICNSINGCSFSPTLSLFLFLFLSLSLSRSFSIYIFLFLSFTVNLILSLSLFLSVRAVRLVARERHTELPPLLHAFTHYLRRVSLPARLQAVPACPTDPPRFARKVTSPGKASARKKHPPVGPYSSPMPRHLW